MDTNSFPTPFIVTVFYQAYAFNQDISKWDVSKVTNTLDMFNTASSFNRTWCSEDFKIWEGKTVPADFAGSQGRLFCCPPGQYYDSSSTTPFFCERCGLGKYTINSSIATTCDKCPRGFSAAALGTAECGPCPLGKYSTAKRDECKICGAGFYQIDGIEESSCEKCSKAKYQDSGGQYECKDCPAGWYQGQEAKPFCLPCIPVRDFFRCFFRCCCWRAVAQVDYFFYSFFIFYFFFYFLLLFFFSSNLSTGQVWSVGQHRER